MHLLAISAMPVRPLSPGRALSPARLQSPALSQPGNLSVCDFLSPTAGGAQPVSPQSASLHPQQVLLTPNRSQSHLLSPRTPGGPVRAIAFKDLISSQQPKLAKFLDAKPQSGVDTKPHSGQTTPVVAALQPQSPARARGPSRSVRIRNEARSASAQPSQFRQASSGVASSAASAQPSQGQQASSGVASSALQLVTSKFEDTMVEQMQKLSLAFESSQEQCVADVTSRLKQAEERWLLRLDNECALRDRAVAEMQALIEARLSSLPLRPGLGDEAFEQESATARFEELAAATSRDVEAKLQEVMEEQIQRLTTNLSIAVERQVTDISGQLRQAEERWESVVSKERQERRDDLATAMHQMEKSLAHAPKQAEQMQMELNDLSRLVVKDLDAKFDMLREQTDTALASIADHKEELSAMMRNAAAELCGSLAQQQQQQQEFRGLRQQLREDDSVSRKETPSQQPELTPQAATPQAFESLQELAQDLRKVKKDVQRLDQQTRHHLEEVKLCKNLLEANREASELEMSELRSELQAHQGHFDVLLPPDPREGSLANLRHRVQEQQQQHHVQSEEVQGSLKEFDRKLAEHEEWWSSEVEDLRKFTTIETGSVRKEIYALSLELAVVRKNLVSRISEDGCNDSSGRLHERLASLKEATRKHSSDDRSRSIA